MTLVYQIVLHYTHLTTHTHTQSGKAVTTSLHEEDSKPGSKRSSLSPEVNKIPPLDKQFKKPPPLKNRRTPSKQHLKQLATASEPSEQGEPVCVLGGMIPLIEIPL